MLAAFAEHEREQISARTKAALTSAKARGVLLGKTGKDRARENIHRANEFALQMTSIIQELRDCGHTTVRSITEGLNRRSVPTLKGGEWHVPTVHRLLKRIESLRS